MQLTKLQGGTINTSLTNDNVQVDNQNITGITSLYHSDQQQINCYGDQDQTIHTDQQRSEFQTQTDAQNSLSFGPISPRSHTSSSSYCNVCYQRLPCSCGAHFEPNGSYEPATSLTVLHSESNQHHYHHENDCRQTHSNNSFVDHMGSLCNGSTGTQHNDPSDNVDHRQANYHYYHMNDHEHTPDSYNQDLSTTGLSNHVGLIEQAQSSKTTTSMCYNSSSSSTVFPGMVDYWLVGGDHNEQELANFNNSAIEDTQNRYETSLQHDQEHQHESGVERMSVTYIGDSSSIATSSTLNCNNETSTTTTGRSGSTDSNNGDKSIQPDSSVGGQNSSPTSGVFTDNNDFNNNDRQDDQRTAIEQHPTSTFQQQNQTPIVGQHSSPSNIYHIDPEQANQGQSRFSYPPDLEQGNQYNHHIHHSDHEQFHQSYIHPNNHNVRSHQFNGAINNQNHHNPNGGVAYHEISSSTPCSSSSSSSCSSNCSWSTYGADNVTSNRNVEFARPMTSSIYSGQLNSCDNHLTRSYPNQPNHLFSLNEEYHGQKELIDDVNQRTLVVSEIQLSGQFNVVKSPALETGLISVDMGINKTAHSVKSRRGRPRKKGLRAKGKVNGKLWEFIRDLLLSERTNPSFIRWERREDGVFKFVQSDKVAKMWGERKQNPKMTYEKLSRAMRYYYKSRVLLPVFGRRLVYKFGPNATGWMPDQSS